ncbi:YceI family protein [Pedobacter hiemivivus]|uniref:YceI family protein n=1 Tax=Pedobacter hiemivivus TaxID=2530454 RepID=A0A4U1GQ74_9SPHI|nr:YceI family protein [Pedobacter hiemivivus]TKC65300.1 YceI family protein [Pedobacter hiemivivus]
MIWGKRTTNILLGASFTLLQLSAIAQSYVGKGVKLSLFSSTPVEDIRAVNVKGTAVLVGNTREIVVQTPIKGFEFDRKLMQEHFNENYMESDKYPMAKFKGMIDQVIDFTKNGEYDVTASGKLTVHGVDKMRSIQGKVIVKDGAIQILTEFKVPCADHKIKIPTLIITKVAEVISIKVDGKLNLAK